MSEVGLRTVLIGAGRMGLGYAADPVMARHYPYASHAQVLRDHPAFTWGAVVDPDERALAAAREQWNIPLAVRHVQELAGRYDPQVAVVATPPAGRLDVLEALPGLRALVLEKPLGADRAGAEALAQFCRTRGYLVQVNLWRRADRLYRALAAGALSERIGSAQAAFVVYGNGLRNNGTHMVDMVRMLLGEVEAAQAPFGDAGAAEGPLAGDHNVAFDLRLSGGLNVAVRPVSFGHYRENGLVVWGTKGAFSTLQEGLSTRIYPLAANRGMSGEREVQSDHPQPLENTVGQALYELYEDLALALAGGREPCSPLHSALRTERVVDAVIESVRRGGAAVSPD